MIAEPRDTDANELATKHIFGLLENSAERYPERILFKDASGRETRYSEAATRAHALAKGLVLSGLAASDRIALYGERNSSSWCISYLAILKLGAVVVPLDPGLKESELTSLLSDCSAAGVICSGNKVDDFKRIRRRIDTPETIISLDSGSGFGVASIEDLIRKAKRENIRFTEPDPHELAVLIYTSGTTGRPKGVMLSHWNIVSDILAVHQTLAFYPEDVFLSILPLHHTFECTAGFLTPMSKGCKVVFARSLKSAEIVEDIRENKATIMCGVPLVFEKMYISFKRKIGRSSALRKWLFRTLYSISRLGLKRYSYWGQGLFRSLRHKAGLESLRLLVSGGAALSHDVGEFFNAIGLTLVQGYGLSETAPVLSVNPIERNKWGSIGPPLNGVEMRIDNEDAHGIGEIVVKGPMVMLGYYNDPGSTREVLHSGWFFTGDVGHVDSDGYFHITGRSKNVIVSAAGKNIYPEEIEMMLNSSPYIIESLVLGRRQKSGAEDVTAVIVPDLEFILQREDLDGHVERQSTHELIEREVRTICTRLADFKRIKKFYIREDDLPKTTTRKVKRFLEIDESGKLVERRRI